MTDFEGDYYTEYDLQVMYDDMLDETYGTVDIAGITYDTSLALRLVDPIAYETGRHQYADSLLQDVENLMIEGYER